LPDPANLRPRLNPSAKPGDVRTTPFSSLAGVWSLCALQRGQKQSFVILPASSRIPRRVTSSLASFKRSRLTHQASKPRHDQTEGKNSSTGRDRPSFPPLTRSSAWQTNSDLNNARRFHFGLLRARMRSSLAHRNPKRRPSSHKKKPMTDILTSRDPLGIFRDRRPAASKGGTVALQLENGLMAWARIGAPTGRQWQGILHGQGDGPALNRSIIHCRRM